MTCFRIARRKYADLSGDGARVYGGRCNRPGVPAVYASQSIALAVLEVLVHLDKSEMPLDYVVMAIRFPGRSVTRLRSPVLGAGDRPVLRVPSVVIPREYNYVLFPGVAGFEAAIEWIETLDFDRRLLGMAE